MNNSIKLTLAAVALAAATSAQAYNDGDLYVGFSGGPGGTDFIYDLGQASSLQVGVSSWNLSGMVPNLNANTVFGVIGFGFNAGQTDAFAFLTEATKNSQDFGGAGVGNAQSDVQTIAQQLQPGQSRTTSGTDQQGWTYNTHNGAPPASSFQTDFMDPNVVVGNRAYFFAAAEIAGGTTLNNAFYFNPATGILTFQAVPEPATYGAVAGLGVLALALRRQFAKA
jgi:hypothetical protein